MLKLKIDNDIFLYKILIQAKKKQMLSCKPKVPPNDIWKEPNTNLMESTTLLG